MRDRTGAIEARGTRRYHMVIKNNVLMSTFLRHWVSSVENYQDLAIILIAQAHSLYSKGELTESVTILASTITDWFLSLYPWDVFYIRKDASKPHALTDLEGAIPTIIHISAGKNYDMKILDMILILAGSIYIMDRGFLDSGRKCHLHQVNLMNQKKAI